jgi:hypothetical protein
MAQTGRFPALGALGEFHDSRVTATDPHSASPEHDRRLSVAAGVKAMRMNDFISKTEQIRLTAS